MLASRLILRQGSVDRSFPMSRCTRLLALACWTQTSLTSSLHVPLLPERYCGTLYKDISRSPIVLVLDLIFSPLNIDLSGSS